MPAPTMTPEQRAAALEKARIVRAKRSELTSKLSMKMITPAEALDQVSDPVVGRMKVKSFVGSLPGYGKVKKTSAGNQVATYLSYNTRGLCRRRRARQRAQVLFFGVWGA